MTHLVLLVLVLAAMCTCAELLRCDTFCNLTLLHPDLKDLTLCNFQEEDVFATLTVELPKLQRLTIEESVVPDLVNLSLGDVRYVKISGNEIEKLPEINATSLQALDLSNNSLVEVDEQFRTLKNLETLNLSANFLTVIDPDSFNGLESLKCLDLSSNNLTFFEDNVFNSLQSLQYLNLSHNRLEVLNEKCLMNLVRLQQLDVSFNQLVRVELGSLQLPSLARLMLAGNARLGASRKPVLLVGTGQRLQSVDASNIGLEQVPAALTHSIRTLRLVGNSIRTVRCGDLDSYPLLQLLDFDSNGLEVIEDDALGRLDSLSILYLTKNNMTDIPKSLSEKLKVLHLEHNRIQQVRSKDLQGLTSLEVLLLNDNKIRLIEAEAFNQLTSLVTLDISRNPITVLQAGCLSGSMALQVLRLANIAVTAPPKEVSFPLSSTEHLITLDLSKSPGIAQQLLVDTAALAASRQLQELDLSYTELENIRSDLLHFLPQLRIFHIEGNRINCSQLAWLAAWMRRQDEPEYRKVTCASPPELWGTLLVDLQETESTDQTPSPPSKKSYPEQNSANANATEISGGLFNAHNKSEGSFPEVQSVTSDLNSNSSHEERGEMSMFSAERERLHPGLVVLAGGGGVLGAAAALALLAARFRRRRQNSAAPALDRDELEVSSLPGVTELW